MNVAMYYYVEIMYCMLITNSISWQTNIPFDRPQGWPEVFRQRSHVRIDARSTPMSICTVHLHLETLYIYIYIYTYIIYTYIYNIHIIMHLYYLKYISCTFPGHHSHIIVTYSAESAWLGFNLGRVTSSSRFCSFLIPKVPGWRFQSQKQRTLVQLGFIILKHHQPVLGDQQPFFVSHTSQLGSVTLGGMGIEHLRWCLFSSHWWEMLLPRHHSIGSCFRCSCYCHNRSLMSPTSDKINTLEANWANSKLLENTENTENSNASTVEIFPWHLWGDRNPAAGLFKSAILIVITWSQHFHYQSSADHLTIPILGAMLINRKWQLLQ